MSSSRIPVMMMCRELSPGGTERQLAQLAIWLDRSRFAVHVGTFRPEGVRGDELRAAGIPICHVPVRSFRSLTTAAATLGFRRYLRRHDIRVVHAFDVPMDIFAVPVARTFGVPVVLSSQRAHRGLTPGLQTRLLRLVDRLADGVVVNSEAMRQHVSEEGVPGDRIHLIPNGLDLARFNPGDRLRQGAVRDAGTVVGVVCVQRPEKDLATLVRAFARVGRAASADRRLLLVGDGPDRQGLEALAGSLGIREKVAFVGSQADVVPWLRSIDIFVLPSRSEAFSNSLLEAMACGCSCVASNVGGNPELVRDGETGYLFVPGDVDGLASTIARLIEDRQARQEIARRGAELVSGRFGLDSAAGQLAALYARLLEAKGQDSGA
jgi:glycosyltransferase involved in cell wall biosynthesis